MGDANPLELEHMVGFNGECTGSVQFHPTDPDVMISYTGRNVIISNIKDPHQQEFLRGHNEEITSLALSPMGNLIASGQVSSTRVPNSEALVIVWDYRTRVAIYRLMELHDGIAFSRNKVIHLAFSADEAFIAGCDDQPKGGKLCVWHTTTGQLATVAKTGQREFHFLEWGEIIQSTSRSNRKPSYKMYAASVSGVKIYTLEFDIHTMQYALTAETMALPSSGLARSYYCAANLGPKVLVAGSHTGELVVFNSGSSIFRACVPVSQGGLMSIAYRAAPDHPEPDTFMVYCGCGDGKIKLLLGNDLDWECRGETALAGSILSLTLSADATALLAGTSEGNIYLLDARSLDVLSTDPSRPSAPLMASHIKPIGCVAFGASSESFFTGASNGSIRRWNLSHYGVEYEINLNARASHNATTEDEVKPECMAVGRAGEATAGPDVPLLTGWSDGTIRCYRDATGELLWEIPGAHRGPVTCVRISPLYMVSGGKDGCVRVWGDGPSRALVGNFDEHRARVTGLCIDSLQPALVHSCAEDKTLVTVDLQQARRTHCHVVKDGTFTNMAQSGAGDHPLLTSDAAGTIKWWDADLSEQPLSMVVTWHPQDEAEDRKLTHLALSPEGSEYLLVSTAAGDIQVWDLRQPSQSDLISQGSAHSHSVTQACWSPDGKQIVSVSKDSCICVWNFYGA